jgi:hypothetical protein
MKRILALLTASLAFVALASAQNTMPQSPTQGTPNNQNAPQMQMNPAQPSASSSPSSTVAPAPATSDSKPADTKSSDAKSSDVTADDDASTPDSKSTDSKATDESTKSNSDAAGSAAPNTEEKTTAPKIPHTEMLGTPSTGPQSADPLLQPAPMPPNKSTLVGGLATKVDRIKNRVVVAPFGSSKKMTVQFDERSHIFRDGRETTILGIHKGDRVYVDTQLVGPTLFARNLRVVTITGPAEAAGQVVAYDARTQTVRVVDKLTNQPVIFRITKDTNLRSKSGQPSLDDIRPGSLISVVFEPGKKGGDAKEVSVLATPGSNYIFAGRVTNLDMHNGVLNVENQSDGKNYELHFNPSSMENRLALRVGSQIAANAAFDGRTYSAKDVTLMPEQESAQQ